MGNEMDARDQKKASQNIKSAHPQRRKEDAMSDALNTDFNPDDPEQVARAMALLKARGRNSYEYLARPLTRVCPSCGQVFETIGRGRPKRFCSKSCRLRYHHKNPDPSNWASTRIAVCPVCGGEFQATREYNRPRKYCSRACANKARALKRKGLLKETEERL